MKSVARFYHLKSFFESFLVLGLFPILLFCVQEIFCDSSKTSRIVKSELESNKIDQLFDYLSNAVEPPNFDVKVDSNIKAALKNKYQSSPLKTPYSNVNQMSSAEYSENDSHHKKNHNYDYKYKLEEQNLAVQLASKHDYSLNNVNDDRKKFWRKLKIPKGSELSLSFQVSRPNVLPGFFFQPEGIIMDAVIEVPISFDIDVFANAVYSKPKPGKPHEKPEKPEKPEEKSSSREGGFLGLERCFLYSQFEMLAARILRISQSVAHSCILRTICEIHSIVKLRPHYQNASIIFELIRLFMTPSLGLDDDCYTPYLHAENRGKQKALCYHYTTKCPISISNLIMHNFIPSFLH